MIYNSIFLLRFFELNFDFWVNVTNNNNIAFFFFLSFIIKIEIFTVRIILLSCMTVISGNSTRWASNNEFYLA